MGCELNGNKLARNKVHCLALTNTLKDFGFHKNREFTDRLNSSIKVYLFIR
jgi:hypothetical protein